MKPDSQGLLDGKAKGIVAVEDDPNELPVIENIGMGESNVSKASRQNDIPADRFAKTGDDLKKYKGVSPQLGRRRNTLIKSFKGEGDSGTKKKEVESASGYSLFDVVAPPYNLDYLAALNEANPTHYAAIKAKVANIVGLGYNFIENPRMAIRIDETEDADAQKKLRRKLNKGRMLLQERLDKINSEDSFMETLIKVWTDYETTGNGYIEVGRIQAGPAKGRIGYIGHINATTVRIRRERDGFVQIISNKAVFFRNFGEDTTDPVGGDPNPNEIIHIKKYAPSSGYYGLPDILAALNAVVGMEFAARFNLDYFENKAVPRHVIILKGAKLGARAESALLEFFETGLKGKNHRSLYIPLPSGDKDNPVEFRIEAVEAGVQDSSFNKYDDSNIDKILMVHRTPRTKVSASGGMNLANARDLDKTFKEQVCQPEQTIFEIKLNKIFKEMNDMFLIALNEMTLTDADTQSKIDEREAKIGKVTRNELRARDGHPALPDKGDEIIDINKPEQPANNANSASQVKAKGNRSRDSARSAASSDSAGEGRQTKGEGRATS